MNDNLYCYNPTYFTLSAINLTPRRLWSSDRFSSSLPDLSFVNQKENINRDTQRLFSVKYLFGEANIA